MTDRIGYADIAAHYRRMIVDGQLKPGDVLPTMKEVCETFSVSITTANRAFKMLKNEGLTSSNWGGRTMVVSQARASSTGRARLERLERTGNELAAGETTKGHTAALRSCHDLQICRELDIEPGDEIVVRRRVFVQDGRPTVVAISCIHPRALVTVPEVLQQGPLKPFWQKTYTERTKKPITRSPERRGARLASDDELFALEVEVPPSAAVAVLVLHTTFHDEAGPIEVWEDVHAPGLWQVADR